MEAVFSVHLSSTVLSLLFVKNCSTTTKTSAKTKAKIEFNFDDFQQRQLFNLKISQDKQSISSVFCLSKNEEKCQKNQVYFQHEVMRPPQQLSNWHFIFHLKQKVNIEFRGISLLHWNFHHFPNQQKQMKSFIFLPMFSNMGIASFSPQGHKIQI